MTARRPYRSGSIGEVKPGVFRVVATAGSDPVTGKRRQVVRSVRGTRADAQRVLTALLADHDQSGHQATAVAVEHLLRRFMTDAELAPATRADYERVIAKWLGPLLGHLPVAAVTPVVITATWRRALKDGASPHRIKRAHVILSGAFKEGRRIGWVTSNPCEGIAPKPPPKAATRPAPEPSVLRHLLALVAEDVELHTWLRLAIATGGRRGEVLALRWDDVDWDTSRLRIDESVTYSRAVGVVVKSTKTGDVRHVALDPDTMAALYRLRSMRDEQGALMGSAVRSDHLLLARSADGVTPQLPTSVSRRFRLLRAQVPGAEDIRLHDLRHAAASLLLAAGHDLRTVADRLGHKRPSITLEVYASAVRSAERAAATTMGDLLAEPGEET